jgi:hypothetical protein
MNTISWKTAAYPFTEKSRDWYIALVIISISLIGASILLKNPLFAIFIAIAATSLVIFSKRPPESIDCEVGDRGVVLGSIRHPYSSLESFWIVETDQPKLLLRSKKLVAALITTPIGDADATELRAMLGKHLVEEELREPFLMRLLERAGF